MMKRLKELEVENKRLNKMYPEERIKAVIVIRQGKALY